MSFEILHFRGAQQILEEKDMVKDLTNTLTYLDDVLYGAAQKRELLRQALDEMGWRKNRSLEVIRGRRYYYKGLKMRVALEGSFASYEYILEGLLRLQIGYKKQDLDMGILLLPAQRGERTPYGSTRQLVEEEIDDLFPVIDLPVTIVLYDLGKPGMEPEVEKTQEVTGDVESQTEERAEEKVEVLPAEDHRGLEEVADSHLGDGLEDDLERQEMTGMSEVPASSSGVVPLITELTSEGQESLFKEAPDSPPPASKEPDVSGIKDLPPLGLTPSWMKPKAKRKRKSKAKEAA